MKELLRTNDPVKISFVVNLLEQAGLNPFVADEHTSAVEGSISAIPRRIMMPDDEHELAVRHLKDVDVD